MNFLPLTEPNPSDNPGQVKVSPEIDAEKCDSVSNNYVDDDKNCSSYNFYRLSRSL